MDTQSPEMKQILEAVAIFQQGETERGRTLLLELWARLGADGAPLQACTIAHILADAEADVADELEWDLRALEAATGSREAEDRDALPSVPASFLPSLHLNLGDCYRRLGDFEHARRHALLASNRVGALPDDGYGKTIENGVRRLQERLAIL